MSPFLAGDTVNFEGGQRQSENRFFRNVKKKTDKEINGNKEWANLTCLASLC